MNRCLVVWFLAFCAAVTSTVTGADDNPVVADLASAGHDDYGSLVAYAWSPEAGQFPHIVPMYWLNRRNFANHVRAKDATDAMPDGHRVLFLWDILNDMYRHPDDRCRDADGNLTNVRGIWWDHGAADVAAKLDGWFSEFHRIGGQVDVVVLDYEVNFSNWSLGENSEPYAAIMTDSRFADVAEELGFADLDPVQNWRSGDNYLRWNVLMERREAEYINQAVYEPLTRVFPDARFSNYDFFHRTDDHPCPNRHGHDRSPFGGTHVGTHQAPEVYGWLSSLQQFSLVEGRFDLFGAGPKYGGSPFAALRFGVNTIRAARLSSDVPLMPWVSHKRFNRSQLRDGDLYQELILHVGLTGPDALLFWNPRTWRDNQNPEIFTSREQEQLLGEILTRLNEMFRDDPRETLVDQLVEWYADYVLTGMRIGDRSVWRFTPLLEDGAAVETTVVQAEPATFRTAAATIVIPNGTIQIYEQPVSQAGVWVVAPSDARPEIQSHQR